MIEKFRELEQPVDATEWLLKEMIGTEGATDFIHAVKTILNKDGKDLVWYVGMISHFNKHPDLLIGNLIRTRVHFRNIMMTSLHNEDYVKYQTFAKNWADLLAVCRYLDPNWNIPEEKEEDEL